jgi:hypothetical protein
MLGVLLERDRKLGLSVDPVPREELPGMVRLEGVRMLRLLVDGKLLGRPARLGVVVERELGARTLGTVRLGVLEGRADRLEVGIRVGARVGVREGGRAERVGARDRLGGATERVGVERDRD